MKRWAGLADWAGQVGCGKSGEVFFLSLSFFVLVFYFVLFCFGLVKILNHFIKS